MFFYLVLCENNLSAYHVRTFNLSQGYPEVVLGGRKKKFERYEINFIL